MQTSSNIKEVGYDAATQVLEVMFSGGGVYQYDGVPKEFYDHLLTESSPGRFFHQNIKGTFPFRKVS
jgi:hypothetical protein